MIAEILRLAVAAYFLFSGVNKVFFFDRFSEFINSFFGFPGGLAAVLAGAVILVEIIFAVVVVFWSGKLLPRILALALAVPFIGYNAWIFFVLGLSSCNCTYSASGESMTSPLFSIAVLLATLVAVFYFTSVRKRAFTISPQAGALLLIALVSGGANAYIWHQYQTSDLAALHLMISEQVEQSLKSQNVQYEVFVQLEEGRPSRAALFINKLLQSSGGANAYIVRTESVKRIDDMMLNVQSEMDSTILTPPENGRLEHLGLQVYRDGALVHRTDQLPEMTAAEYEVLITALSEENEELSLCDRSTAANELHKIVRRHIEAPETDTPLISAHLLMERTCAECDADVLAMLDSYFFDQDMYEVNIAYFMNSEPEDGRGISIPPTELATLQSWCLYPHKLLLIAFGPDDVVALPVPAYLEQLDQAINSEFEQRDLSLF